jgi:FkbM family methyltransferase
MEYNRVVLKKRMAALPCFSAVRKILIPLLRGYFRYFPLRSRKVTVWNQVAGHLWWLESRVCAETLFGSTLHVDARDYCGRFIYYFGIWEPHLTSLIENRLNPGDFFVDVGANVGHFSLPASTIVGRSGRVISIEAIPRTFDVLTRNIGLNHAENICALNVAAWHKDDRLTFLVSPATIDGTSTAMLSVAEQRGFSERVVVRAAPLWTFLRPEEIMALRLIKIQVEGAERHVVAGLGPVLERGRRNLEVVIELSIDAFEEVVAFFRKYGFFSYRLENDYSAASCIIRN